MVVSNPLYQRATELAAGLDEVPLGRERVRGARKWAAYSINETRAFLRDYARLSEQGTFSEKELATMLANSMVETGSFLFSAGAPAESWRAWLALAARALPRAGEPGYAMQLAAIARSPDEDAAFRDAAPTGFRDQAIQSILFHAGQRQPADPPVNHPLDDRYAELREAVARDDVPAISSIVNRIARFWLDETGYGPFQPHEAPVFEPEINAVVASLTGRGMNLELADAKVRRFLQAGLE
ncbi:MAG TPA: hypothetical protein VHG93_27670 [Longimicrobium sp.]|nr:hypothetical protein [Longimicrobium sp.]